MTPQYARLIMCQKAYTLRRDDINVDRVVVEDVIEHDEYALVRYHRTWHGLTAPSVWLPLGGQLSEAHMACHYVEMGHTKPVIGGVYVRSLQCRPWLFYGYRLVSVNHATGVATLRLPHGAQRYKSLSELSHWHMVDQGTEKIGGA